MRELISAGIGGCFGLGDDLGCGPDGFVGGVGVGGASATTSMASVSRRAGSAEAIEGEVSVMVLPGERVSEGQ